jgi:general secretion pathway protein G
MRFKTMQQTGFTIVELLIVIVVVAILASVSVVAYSGVQNKANDTTVQSDLYNFAKKITMYHANNGEYPKAGSRSSDSTKFPGMTFLPSKGAYDIANNNLYYCDGTVNGVPAFIVMAKSKSKEVYGYSSSSGAKAYGKISLSTTCQGLDVGTTGYSYGFNPGPTYGWFSWANS